MPKSSDRVFVLIATLFLLYCGLFIYNSSFVVEGKRYFCLFDDEMISMQYARNLANGHGLVWNPGEEKVEGYTNFLWVLFMSVFHWLPIDESKTSLFIEISGALFLLLTLSFVRKIALHLSNGSHVIANGAAALTAFYFPLVRWCLSGTEVSVLTFLIVLCVWRILQMLESENYTLEVPFLLAVATLIRLDMVVPFLVMTAFLIWNSPKKKLFLLQSFGLLAFVVLSKLLFSMWYYGDPLPNTYYLKMTGYPAILRVATGLITALLVIGKAWFVFGLATALLFVRRDRPVILLLAICLAQFLYSVSVGGDAWEFLGGTNRYMSLSMPIVFVLFSLSLAEIPWQKLSQWSFFSPQKWKLRAVSLMTIALINLNATDGPRSLLQWLKLESFERGTQETIVRYSLIVRRITTEQAKVGVVYAGATRYFTQRAGIDFLGKNDTKIAREPMRTSMDPISWLNFYPGHLKWNYQYSIGELKPDVIREFWGGLDFNIATDYERVDVDGIVIYLRKGSKQIHWDQLKEAETKNYAG